MKAMVPKAFSGNRIKPRATTRRYHGNAGEDSIKPLGVRGNRTGTAMVANNAQMPFGCCIGSLIRTGFGTANRANTYGKQRLSDKIHPL